MQRLFFLISIFMFIGGSIYSYETIDSHLNRYYDLLALQGILEKPTLNIDSLAFNRWDMDSAKVDHPWKKHIASERKNVSKGAVSVSRLDTTLEFGYNSAYPYGMNDGPQWQGKGFNSKVTSGLMAEYKGLSATIFPVVWYAQNRSFPIMDSAIDNEYGYFTYGMDLPQRFGDDPVYEFSWGESEVRYDYQNLTIGFGNQSMWIGPGYKNAIILSNNAGGFPKVDLALRKTETAIGDFEGILWWGRLTQSEYFIDPDDNPNRESPHNLFTGLSLSFAPNLLPGFTVGLNRVAFSKWEDTNASLLTMMFNPIMTSDLGQDESCQRASITLDWSFPEVGFNVYAEWARNDYSPGLRDNILLAPEHSQGYTIGGTQAMSTQDGFFAIQAELTQLIKSRTYQINSLGDNPYGGQTGFYSHGTITQGHTHEGQLLGAGIGSGSDSQYLGVDYYYDQGKIGGYIQRISRNKDYLYGDVEEDKKTDPYLLRLNVEIVVGVKLLYLLDNSSFNIDTGVGYNINRNYVKENDIANIFIRTKLNW